VVTRCAGWDVHKDTVMACMRTPAPQGGRRQEVRQFRTVTPSLHRLRDWLIAEGITQVATQGNRGYWRPVFHVLEDTPGRELLLVNAYHVTKVPGRTTEVRCGLAGAAGRVWPAAGQLRAADHRAAAGGDP
jgi:transposase